MRGRKCEGGSLVEHLVILAGKEKYQKLLHTELKGHKAILKSWAKNKNGAD